MKLYKVFMKVFSELWSRRFFIFMHFYTCDILYLLLQNEKMITTEEDIGAEATVTTVTELWAMFSVTFIPHLHMQPGCHHSLLFIVKGKCLNLDE